MGATAGHALEELDDQTRRRVTDESFEALATASDPEQRCFLLDRVVVANLQVARAIALRYRDRGIPLEDLEQTAAMALVSACHSFDATRGHDFLSFAVPTIRGAVLKYFRDQGWAVRPPRRIRDLQSRILRESSTLEAWELDVEELAAQLGEEPSAIVEALAARGCFQPTSLDAPVGEGDLTRGQLLSDAEDAVADILDRMAAASAIRALDDRARRMLHLRFVRECTQQAIADELGTSQVQVSRELTRIIERLRELIVATVDNG